MLVAPEFQDADVGGDLEGVPDFLIDQPDGDVAAGERPVRAAAPARRRRAFCSSTGAMSLIASPTTIARGRRGWNAHARFAPIKWVNIGFL
ncbi:MAG: hypothetical protein IIA01_02415 [Proteobacteria bacterium]|nr:hypothetical protein [Pseudomonadota bacterium]